VKSTAKASSNAAMAAKAAKAAQAAAAAKAANAARTAKAAQAANAAKYANAVKAANAARAAQATKAANAAAVAKANAAAKAAAAERAATKTTKSAPKGNYQPPSPVKSVQEPPKVKTPEPAKLPGEPAKVEAATKSNLLPVAGVGLATGMIGLGLGSFLGGGGETLPEDPLMPTDPTIPIDPTIPEIPEIPDYVPPEYVDPLTEEIDPAYWDMLNGQLDQIDAAEAAGTITSEEADAMREQIYDQIDEAGGYFDPAFGEGTPYEAIEQIAQDATRSIPGDLLEWFRHNGLAAPAIAGLLILVAAVIFVIYKRIAKGKHKAGHKRSAKHAGSPAGSKVVIL